MNKPPDPQLNQKESGLTQAQQQVAAKAQELEQAKNKDTAERKDGVDVNKKEQELNDAKAAERARAAEVEQAKNTASKLDEKGKAELNKTASTLAEKKEFNYNRDDKHQHEFYSVEEKKQIEWKEFQSQHPQELEKAKKQAQVQTSVSKTEDVFKAELGTLNSPYTPYANPKPDVANKYGRPLPKEPTPEKEPKEPEK